MRLKGKAYYNPARQTWGKVVGKLAYGNYYVCREPNTAIVGDKAVVFSMLIERVVFIGDMKDWSFAKNLNEAMRMAEILEKK